MSDRAQEVRVELLLSTLRLPTVKKLYRKIAKEVAASGGDFVSYLLALLEEESSERRSRPIQRRIKDARFRQTKLLSELEAEALPARVSMDLLGELAT